MSHYAVLPIIHDPCLQTLELNPRQAKLTRLSTPAKIKIGLGKYLDTLPDNPPTQEIHSRNSLLDFTIKDRTGGCFGTLE